MVRSTAFAVERTTDNLKRITHHLAPGSRPLTLMTPEEVKAYVSRLTDALGDRDPFAVMGELPSALRTLTAGLDDAQMRIPEGPGKWSVIQVLEHLADHETINGFRLRSTIAEDAPVLRGYDQTRWVARLHYGDADAETVLREVETARRRTVRLLQALSPAELERVGMHAERGPESVRLNIAITAGHDIVHRRQIARIRAAIGLPLPERTEAMAAAR